MSQSQENFLRSGGPLAAVLEQKYESGELQRSTPWQEYPKMLRVHRGVEHVTRHTDVIRGNQVVSQEWVEDVDLFDDILVHDEAEEERVLQGGKTSAQVEDERQDLIRQAKARGLKVDPTWTTVRIQRELGEQKPNETVMQLQRQVEELEEKAALRRRIAELEAQIARREEPAAVTEDEVTQLRASLKEYGLHVDMRWGVQRLRDELEAATRPDTGMRA